MVAVSEADRDLPEGYEVVSDDGAVVTVRLTCAGCGDEVKTIDMFADRLSDLESEPLHDSFECASKARGGA